MTTTVGSELAGVAAYLHVTQLERRMSEGEELRYVGGAQRMMGYDLHVVTSDRVLCVSSKRDYDVQQQFQVAEVVRAFTADDRGDSIVHVILVDDGHFLMRPHPTAESAGALAQEITRAAAAKHPPREDPLMPRDRPGPTLLEQAGFDYLQIVVPREEVEAGDVLTTLGMLAPLIQSRRIARAFMERVAIYVAGYDDVTWELFEIDAVRDFVHSLDERFPYWLYFLDKRTGSFDAIWRCMMPPLLTAEAQQQVFPTHLEPLLRNWWTPAMDRVAEFAGLSEAEHYALCERYADYFQGRRDF
ncbi:hypothetical protein [Nocardioides kribbensis]|uniref:hypothetical protein n=1 Tax=Nocardioides kribbensis TaxID=305517 RepID=UPI00187A68E9|nr:hypothetical protein [Nocardioides kribbensis]